VSDKALDDAMALATHANFEVVLELGVFASRRRDGLGRFSWVCARMERG
jgi:hypothetical protein